jgi:hypothetical protein
MNITFKTTFFVGLFTLLIAGFMMFYKTEIKPQNVSNKAYQKAPMIAFEFAETADDINKLFYINKQNEKIPNQEFMDKMDFLNKIDFLFIISYVIFLAFFSISLSKQNIVWLGYLGAFVSVVIGLADVIENVQLLAILKKVNLVATYQPALTLLNTWTWIKWGLLGLIMVILLPCLFRKDSNIYDLMVGTLMVMVAILGLVAFVSKCPNWIAHYTQFIFLLFPIIILYSLAMWREWIGKR